MAFVLLTVLLPILILVALFIFVADFHSPFFFQDRVGLNKRMFKIVKFRTMLDGKITKLGMVLRRTGIDELPQMINILLGKMSFVGPRPLTVADIDRLQWNSSYYEQRWNVRPGIVGLAQLSPICHKKMSWFFDQYYIRKQSLWLDFRILSSSVLIPFVGKKQVKKWLYKK
jgi:lipopolysaccharide/colanic/teichoic acid biosynthesis glycosyltransferase